MLNSRNTELQREQHKRNLIMAGQLGDDSTLTRQECLDLMAAAISVQDWNALREIVKADYEFASIPSDMQKLLHEIDGNGLIVKALKANEKREFGEVPADMVVDLDDVRAGRFEDTLDDSEG